MFGELGVLLFNAAAVEEVVNIFQHTLKGSVPVDGENARSGVFGKYINARLVTQVVKKAVRTLISNYR